MSTRLPRPIPRPVLDPERAPRVRENLLVHGQFGGEVFFLEEGDEVGEEAEELGDVGWGGREDGFEVVDLGEAFVGGKDIGRGGGAEGAGAGEAPGGFKGFEALVVGEVAEAIYGGVGE